MTTSVNKKCYRVEAGSLPRKFAKESMTCEDNDTLAVYSLFFDNSRAFLYFTYNFLGNDTSNDEL